MDWFVSLSWLMLLTTCGVLIGVLSARPWMVVKPSVSVVVFFHIMIQWAAALNARDLFDFLPNPWPFLLLAQAFPLLVLAGSMVTFNGAYRKVWLAVTSARVMAPPSNTAIRVLGVVVVLVSALYLSYVPLRTTGLYMIFTDPLQSQIAREDSLKLIESPLVRYSFSFMVSAFVPLLAVLLWGRSRRGAALGSWAGVTRDVALIAALLVIVSPTSARSYAASVLLTVLFSEFLRKASHVRPFFVIGSGLSVLTIPTILTVLRQGEVLTFARFWDQLLNGMLGRVFYGPMMVGSWYVHYAQTYGFVGVGGVPKLAFVLNKQVTDVQNVIGLTYVATTIDTISANGSFVFSYYCYFGLMVFPLCVAGIWALDLAVIVYERLIRADVLLACVASISVAVMSVVSTDYATALISSGIVMVAAAAYVLDGLSSSSTVWHLSTGRPSQRRSRVLWGKTVRS